MNIYQSLYNCDFEAIKHYIESGGDVTILDERSQSFLHIVVVGGHFYHRTDFYKIIDLLLKAGVDPNISDELNNTVLDYIPLNYDSMKLVLDHNYDINHINRTGSTFLHRVGCHPDLIKLALDYGADPNIKDNYGKLALDYAREFNWIESIQLLEEASNPIIKEPGE